MRIVAPQQLPSLDSAPGGFHVVGLRLPEPTQQHLATAFPETIFHDTGGDLLEQTQALCDRLGQVVLFTYIPAMPDRHWLRASAVFHRNTVKLLGIDPHCTASVFDRAFDADFDGVIQADADSTALSRAAHGVHQGELWFPRAYLSKRLRRSSPSPANITAREAELLDLLARGLTNQAIADKLFVTRDTIRWHLRSIYTKLGVSDRDAALRLARNNLVPQPHQSSA